MTVVAPGQQKKLELRGSSVATWISPLFFCVPQRGGRGGGDGYNRLEPELKDGSKKREFALN